MSRILAVDYGRKRVGLAVTDKAQIIANGLDTVSSNYCISYLENYFAKEDVELIVIGYPKKMNNQASEAVVYVDRFISDFKKKFPGKEYFLIDERFTSKMAFQAMIDGGLKKKQRQDKAMIDKVSATIILQSYLEMRDNNLNSEGK
ncbi:MAG: Holliday junction resolvase RuvX [Bacteroidales bacterium]|nr:Holliday junction resolvase RuvX [Bacteroidales bacterium]